MPKKAASEAAAPSKRKLNPPNPKGVNAYSAIKTDDNITALMVQIMTWPDVNLQDAQQVQQRIADYIIFCNSHEIRPGIAGMAASLGIERKRLWDIKNGIVNKYSDKYNVPKSVQDVVKKAYDTMEAMWEYSMQSGKINPPCGIFLGKNNFGYQDVVDYNITPKQDTSVLPSEDLQKRLESLPDE